MFGEPCDILLVFAFAFLRELVFWRYGLTFAQKRGRVPCEVLMITSAGIDHADGLPEWDNHRPAGSVGLINGVIRTGGEVRQRFARQQTKQPIRGNIRQGPLSRPQQAAGILGGNGDEAHGNPFPEVPQEQRHHHHGRQNSQRDVNDRADPYKHTIKNFARVGGIHGDYNSRHTEHCDV